MLSTSDCFRTIFPPNSTNFSCPISSNQTFIRNPIPQTECKISENSKLLQKRVSYGGIIPHILDSLKRIEDLDMAFKPWNRLSSKERTVILNEQSDWRRAMEIFEWFKNHGPYQVNQIHYNVMLKLLCKAQRLDLLLNLFLDMQINNINPSNCTYTTLIHAYSKSGDIKSILIWIGDMYKRGVSPCEICIVTVLNAYNSLGEYEEVERIFKRFLTGIKPKPETRRGFNIMIHTFVKSGQFNEALNAFNDMISQGIVPDSISYNTIIQSCCNNGKYHEISKFVSILIKRNCLPDSKSHESILLLCIKRGEINLAEKYFANIKGRNSILDYIGFRKLLFSYSEYKMVRRAETLIREIELKGIIMDEYTQTALTKMYIKANLINKAWNWFEKFIDSTSLEFFAANINAFGEKGYLSLAEKAFNLCIQKRKLNVSVFNVMIKAYGIGKEYEKGCKLVDNMEDKYGISPDICTYNTLIIILSEQKYFEKASLYAKKLVNSNLVLGEFSYSILIGAFVKTRELDLAENLFDEMSDRKMKIDRITFAKLIDGYAKIGNLEMATKYLNLMKKAGMKVNFVICTSLIKLYTKTGNLLEALETYRLSKSLTGTIDFYSSNCMMSLYCDNSMVKEAEEIFSELKICAKANEFSYTVMIKLYRKLGRYKEAFRVSREMEKLGFLSGVFSYNAVMAVYFIVNKVKSAIRIFWRMLKRNVNPNEATFRVLRLILVNRGVLKGEIGRIEKIRRRNGEEGLTEWIKLMKLVGRFDEGVYGKNVKLRGENRKKSFVRENLRELVHI